jgi:predicted Zn-dependent protease
MGTKNRVSVCCLLLFLLIYPAVQGEGQRDAGAVGVSNALSQLDQAIASAEANEFSPADEYYLGRAVAANILSRYRPYTQNAALTGYVNKICSALVINSPNPELFNGYHVLILDSTEINAFATPGGHIFITQGLINCANSEDALAAVIAHEIAHIQLKHSVGLIKDTRAVQQLRTIANEAAATATREAGLNDRTLAFGESVTAIVDTMFRNGFAQTQEFDADTLALRLLSTAGYQPSGMVDMLKVLQQRQPGISGGFNTTHPSPAQRLANVDRAARSYGTVDGRNRTARFRAMR